MKFPKEEGSNVRKDWKQERQIGNALEKNEQFSLNFPVKKYRDAKMPHFQANNTVIRD